MAYFSPQGQLCSGVFLQISGGGESLQCHIIDTSGGSTGELVGLAPSTSHLDQFSNSSAFDEKILWLV